MSSVEQHPVEQAHPTSQATEVKPTAGKVLACAKCKERRVKCSRNFPCTNCVRAGVQCVQPVLLQRRRRFAERALLDRLGHYEDLLRQHNVSFEPLHGPNDATMIKTGGESIENEQAPPDLSKRNEVIDVWQMIKRVALDDEEDDSDSSHYEPPDVHVKIAIHANDHLLFGAPDPEIHLPSLHPDQVQIFRLWQTYLDNVDPLLKVTHAPSLQSRIIDAAGSVETVSDSLEALMFSIYCVAILSITNEECLMSFHTPRETLLALYQFACKQALLKCTPWRSNDRDCLTALYLYLLSVGGQVDPRSLACMVAVAIRIAQRMGMHYESSYAAPNISILEAELRRRLWWSLVLLDNRLCEIVGQELSTSLTPLWDCRPPVNVNDFEMIMGSKTPLPIHASPTESLFVVVRAELANYARHSASHLATCIVGTTPSTNHKPRRESDLDAFEALIESKYLSRCNPDIALHYMTIWNARSFFARRRLMEHHLRQVKSPSDKLEQSDADREKAYSFSVRMLECDTRVRASALTRGYLWFVEALRSPIVAYIHVLNGLVKGDVGEIADEAWKVVCENYDALAAGPVHHRTRVMFRIKLSGLVLQIWEGRLSMRREMRMDAEAIPAVVVDAQLRAAEIRGAALVGEQGPVSVGFTPASSGSNTHVASGDSGSSSFPPRSFGEVQTFGGGADFAGVTGAGGLPFENMGKHAADAGMDQFLTDDILKWL